MSLFFDLDPDRCCACGACVIACLDQNDIDPDGGEQPRRLSSGVEYGEKQAYLSVSCFHCDDAPCIMACPVGCLSKDEETGFTVYDNSGCIGCHSCAMACPFGAPAFGADGKMYKCDGCNTRVRCGLEPACLSNCATGAIRLFDKETLEEQHAKRSLRMLTRHLLS